MMKSAEESYLPSHEDLLKTEKSSDWLSIAIMVYEPLNTMFSKYGNSSRLLKIKNKLTIDCFFQIKLGRILDIL